MRKKYYLSLFVISVSASILLIINFLLYPIVGADSGFYLAIAKEFYSGAIYFKDIGVNYNPLSIILFGLPFVIFENPSYSLHLGINISVLLGSAILFYKIIDTWVSSRLEVLGYTSFFLILCLVLDGKYVLLEPLSVFFQLAALYTYISKNQLIVRIFLTGIFISLSFLSKQYGLFILLPIVIHVLTSRKVLIKQIISLGFGFSIPIVFLYIYLATEGLGFMDFINAIIGRGIAIDKGLGTGAGTTFFSYPIDVIYLFFFNSYLFLIPFILFRNRRKVDREVVFYITLVFSSFSILAFANYWHYYQYIVPYLLILYVLINHKQSYLSNKWGSLSIGFSVFVLITYSFFSKNTMNITNKQLKEASLINDIIPVKSHVYLDGLSAAYYYLCDFKSIDLKKIGFNFPGCFYPKTILNSIDESEYLIVKKEQFDKYKDLINSNTIDELLINDVSYLIIKK